MEDDDVDDFGMSENGPLCLDAPACRAACDAIEGCLGYSAGTIKPRCFLSSLMDEAGTVVDENYDAWTKVGLVERYDAVKFGIFQRNLSNFKGLVLFCIEADFCNQILILSHFVAFFEIYKICTPSHRSILKIFAKFRQTFFAFLLGFLQKS